MCTLTEPAITVMRKIVFLLVWVAVLPLFGKHGVCWTASDRPAPSCSSANTSPPRRYC